MRLSTKGRHRRLNVEQDGRTITVDVIGAADQTDDELRMMFEQVQDGDVVPVVDCYGKTRTTN